MIDHEAHKIGDIVCFSRSEQIIGYISAYTKPFYKVLWNSNMFPHSKKSLTSSFHTDESVSLMKKFLEELYNK